MYRITSKEDCSGSERRFDVDVDGYRDLGRVLSNERWIGSSSSSCFAIVLSILIAELELLAF
jgi:hypothetical protein